MEMARVAVAVALWVGALGIARADDASHGQPHAPRPNFVFILQDDLGFDDIGFNNPESVP
jgi:hypothetical protein